MAKSIKHVSELPKWFSLEKYETAKSLDAAGWYEQLSVRSGMITLMKPPPWWNGCKPSDFSKTDTHSMKVLELIRAKPILNIADNMTLKACFLGGIMHELKSKDLRYSFGVHLTTVRNLYWTENNIKEDKRAHARGFFEQIFNYVCTDLEKPFTFKYECEDWIDEPVDELVENNNSKLNITVNMLLPDKVLIEQFKQLLQCTRNQLTYVGRVIENVEKPNFSAWCEHGVLPYLDLHIWQIETGMKIPNRVMADAIFPPGEGGEEKIRKTTKELADNLLTRKHLETLAALAAQEITEQNNG